MTDADMQQQLQHLRAHLHAIAACHGVTYIADTALVPERIVRELMGTERRRIAPWMRQGLHAVKLRSPSELVPAAGFLRRIDDLALRGFGQAELAAVLGVRRTTVSGWFRLAQTGRVRAHMAARIAAVFVLLQGRRGGNTAVASLARYRGAVPASVWGDRLDDPGVSLPTS